MALALNPTNLPSLPLGVAEFVMDRTLDMNGNSLINLATPVNASDAARLSDIQGITIPVLNSAGATVNVSLSK